MVYIKDPLLLIENSSPCSDDSGFPLSRYLNYPLPYVRRHITVLKCVECFLHQVAIFIIITLDQFRDFVTSTQVPMITGRIGVADFTRNPLSGNGN